MRRPGREALRAPLSPMPLSWELGMLEEAWKAQKLLEN